MNNLIIIIFISVLLSSCITIDSRSNDLSKNKQKFQEDNYYVFSITPSYISKEDKSPINDLGRYFYAFDKNGKYLRIIPKFSSQELIVEILNENKQVISERKLKLLSYSKENLDKSRESKTFYFSNKTEIVKKSKNCVADLGQSCSYYTALIFLDKDGNLVMKKGLI
jgi:ankyrin repeat protein